MKKLFYFILIISISTSLKAQNDIIGKILLPLKEKDTLIFFNGTLSTNYYENTSISVPVFKTEYKISEKFNYPHLYVTQLKSIADSLFFRVNFLFIDNSTTKITLDKHLIPVENDGLSQIEFKDKFLPFITNNNSELKERFFRYSRTESIEFDELLLAYVKNNPNSYVALWFVALRNKTTDFNLIYKNILSLFSTEVKSSKLWKNLNKDINLINIKINNPFPLLTLKNQKLKTLDLLPKKDKIILIDFWFSSCKPCIQKMPEIKSLYEKYKHNGFNVISISTDREDNIKLWKNQIKKLEMTWENYLDINGEIAKQNNIFSYPTTYLLDKNGIVIKKNINLTELEEILISNLKE